MAKKLKKNRIRGAKITPRKDARKLLKRLMVDTFKLFDQKEELHIRFKAGADAILARDDVPQDVKDKFSTFTADSKPSETFIKDMDDMATTVEGFLAQGSVPWNDMEAEVLGITLAMSNMIDLEAANYATKLTEATDLAMLLDKWDEKPVAKKDEPAPVHA